MTVMKLNKRLKRVFIEHKSSYIGMIILIIMSTAVFLGFKTATVSVTNSVNENRTQQNLEDANFKTLTPLNDQQIEKYEKTFDLDIQANPFIEIENGYNEATVRIFPEASTINLPKLYDGKYLSSDNDVMVDRYFFEKQKLSFGDNVKLLGKNYTVTGVFTTPDYLSLTHLDTDFIADGDKFGLILMSKKAFDLLPQDHVELGYSIGFNRDNEEDFRRELSKTSFVTEWVSKETNKRITTFDGENKAIIIMSYIAPMFLLVISTIMLSVVLSRMLKKEYTYIGTLSAMGYRKREILGHYLRIPVFISLVGCIIGVIVGFFLIKPFTLVSSIEYNVPKPHYAIYYWDIALIILFPLILNSAAVALSVWKALRINIVFLLKSNNAKEKRGLLTRLIPHKKLPFRIRFKLKEITTNLPRSFLMLFGIVTASLFIITGFLFYSSVDFLLANNLNNEYGYNYQYVYNKPQTNNKTGGEPYMMASFYYKKDGKNINFTMNGIPDNPVLIRPKNENGGYINTNKTVITKSVAKRMGWKKGDTVTVVSNANLMKTAITIDEICDIRYSDYVYMPLAKLNSILGLDSHTHIGVYSNTLLDIDNSMVSDILTKDDSEAGLETSIASFKTFLYILGVVSAVISLIVVYIVTVMLMEENRKNISMLKVMGYHNKEISGLLLNSTSLLVWIGFALSIPITLSIINRFFDVLTANMFFDFKTSLVWWHGLISFALIISVYYLTLLLAKRKILRINMAESLKARE